MSGVVSDSTGKRSSAIGGDDGVSDSTAKRSSAIGGGGDYDYPYSHYPYPYPYPVVEDDDYPILKELYKLPVYDIQVLGDHIKNFDTDPTIFDGLKKRVASDINDQKIWFSELRKVWKGKESPEEATRLVADVLDEINRGVTNSHDLRGFLEHYGLPSPFDLDPYWFMGANFLKHYSMLTEARDDEALTQ